MRVAVLLLALVAVASARDLYWKGCNTNFNDPTNWKSDAAHTTPASTTNVPKTVYMTADPMDGNCNFQSVDTYVEGSHGMYELVFDPEGVILTLSATGTELVFYSSDQASTKEAVFIGGQAARLAQDDCNFQCHLGWSIRAPNAATPYSAADTAPLPPCDGDSAIFPTPYSYRVDVSGIVNVDKVVFGNTPITRVEDIPAYQVTFTGSNPQLFLNNRANCIAGGTLNATSGRCFCASHCANGGDIVNSNAELRAAVQANAAAKLAADTTPGNRPFTIKLFLNSIISSMGRTVTTVRSDMDCAFGAAAGRAELSRLAIMDFIKTRVPTANFSSNPNDVGDLMINYNSGEMSVTLSSTQFTVQPRAVPGFVTNIPQQSVEPTTSNIFLVQLFQAVLGTVQTCPVTNFKSQLDTYFGNAANCAIGTAECNAIKMLMLNSNNSFAIMTNVLRDIQNTLDNPPANTPPNSFPVYTPSELALNTTVPAFRADAVNYAKTLYAALIPTGADGSIPPKTNQGAVMQMTNPVTGVANSYYQATLTSKLYPSPALQLVSQSVSMLVGGRLPQLDVNKMAQDPLVRADLISKIAMQLPGSPPVLSVNSNGMRIVLDDSHITPNDTCDNQPNRRRADPNAAGQAHTALQITFQYGMMQRNDCVTNDQRSYCPLTRGSASYTSVQSSLDNFVVVYNIRASPNFPCSTAGYKYDVNCIVNYIKDSYCADVLDALPNSEVESGVINGVAATVECPYTNNCADQSGVEYYQAVAQEVLAKLNSTVQCTRATQPPGGGGGASASSSAGGSSTGIGIGIAIAAVVIVAVVVVVVMRRRRGPSSAAKTDRNVVAFENPMYDEPNQGGANAPVYDMGIVNAATETPEGLYDEPAFNANKSAAAARENPVYASTEDVAGGEDDGEGGGYLDVAGGYLDVAADEE